MRSENEVVVVGNCVALLDLQVGEITSNHEQKETLPLFQSTHHRPLNTLRVPLILITTRHSFERSINHLHSFSTFFYFDTYNMFLRVLLVSLFVLLASAAHHHPQRDYPHKRHVPYKRQAGVNLTALNDTIISINGTSVNGTANTTQDGALDFVASTIEVTSYIDFTLSVTQTVDDGTVTVTLTTVPTATGD
jgi:hypothetical protein